MKQPNRRNQIIRGGGTGHELSQWLAYHMLPNDGWRMFTFKTDMLFGVLIIYAPLQELWINHVFQVLIKYFQLNPEVSWYDGYWV